MPNRYSSVPNHDEDAEHELEQAFDVSDDEDDGRAHHQSTPLLQTARSNREHEDQLLSRTPHSTRTPRTQAQDQPVVDGRYNFEYDFPPPGSPPTNLAGPNHWGNSNGILVTEPVAPPNIQPSWLTRTWRRVRGAEPSVVPGRRVGGGTSNDGVFANLSSRPTGTRAAANADAARNPNEPESAFHAPEVTPDDAPPSYLAAQLDAAPPYWENTVLASSSDEVLIDSLPAGSLFGFLWVRPLPLAFLHEFMANSSLIYRASSCRCRFNGSVLHWPICSVHHTPAVSVQRPVWDSPLCSWVSGSENAQKIPTKLPMIFGGQAMIKRIQVLYHLSIEYRTTRRFQTKVTQLATRLHHGRIPVEFMRAIGSHCSS